MEVLKIFGLWDQEIDSWFTNHEPLIPTLGSCIASIAATTSTKIGALIYSMKFSSSEVLFIVS